jgi:hypothetical protein
MSEWDRGYSDGRAGRDKAALYSSDREQYMNGFMRGNDDRRAYGWES